MRRLHSIPAGQVWGQFPRCLALAHREGHGRRVPSLSGSFAQRGGCVSEERLG